MRASTAAMLVGFIVLTATTARAHHAWNVSFTEERPIVVKGILSKVDLVNPHSWFYVDVKNKDGTVTTWAIEGGPPNGLIRSGVNKDTLKLGEALTVRGYGARDGSNQMAGVSYLRADGSEFFLAYDGPATAAKLKGNLK